MIEKLTLEQCIQLLRALLKKLFGLDNFWKHYTNNINASLSNIYECLNMIQRNLEDIEDMVE